MPIKNEVIIRNATEADKDQIEALFIECFGNIAHGSGALDRGVEGRYTVAEIRKVCTNMNVKFAPKIVAVSGIVPVEFSNLNGYEVTWTCTTEEHRKKGLIVQILNDCIQRLPNDHKPIYCSCWRVKDNQKVALSSVMTHLGFRQVLREHKKYVRPHFRYCAKCPHESEGCYCCEDLYIRERQ